MFMALDLRWKRSDPRSLLGRLERWVDSRGPQDFHKPLSQTCPWVMFSQDRWPWRSRALDHFLRDLAMRDLGSVRPVMHDTLHHPVRPLRPVATVRATKAHKPLSLFGEN